MTQLNTSGSNPSFVYETHFLPLNHTSYKRPTSKNKRITEKTPASYRTSLIGRVQTNSEQDSVYNNVVDVAKKLEESIISQQEILDKNLMYIHKELQSLKKERSASHDSVAPRGSHNSHEDEKSYIMDRSPESKKSNKRTGTKKIRIKSIDVKSHGRGIKRKQDVNQ